MKDLRINVIHDYRSDTASPVDLAGNKSGHYLIVSSSGQITDQGIFTNQNGQIPPSALYIPELNEDVMLQIEKLALETEESELIYVSNLTDDIISAIQSMSVDADDNDTLTIFPTTINIDTIIGGFV